MIIYQARLVRETFVEFIHVENSSQSGLLIKTMTINNSKFSSELLINEMLFWTGNTLPSIYGITEQAKFSVSYWSTNWSTIPEEN